MRARFPACRLLLLALAASSFGCSKSGNGSHPSRGHGGSAGSAGGVSMGGRSGTGNLGGSAGDGPSGGTDRGGTDAGGAPGGGEGGEGGEAAVGGSGGVSDGGGGSGGVGGGGSGGVGGSGSGGVGGSGSGGASGLSGGGLSGSGGYGGLGGSGGASGGASGAGGKAGCAAITTCTRGDGCCPSSCNPVNDSDCMGPTYDVEIWADNTNATHVRPTSLDIPYNSYARIRWHNIGAYSLWVVNFGSGTTWSELDVIGPGGYSNPARVAEGPWCGYDFGGTYRLGPYNDPSGEYAFIMVHCVR